MTQAAPLRVLVVDDMAQIRDLTGRMLRARGYLVDTAGTVAEAIALDPASYDVLLVDNQLGADRGTDFVASLVGRHPAARPRCVIMTGAGDVDVPEGVAVLTKPFDADKLIGVLRAGASQEPVLSASGTARPGLADPGPADADLVDPDTASAGEANLIALIRQLRSHDDRVRAAMVHDGPAQHLSSAMMSLELARRTGGADDDAHLDEAIEWVQAAAAAMRDMTGGSARAADAPGLADALREAARAWLPDPLLVRTDGDVNALSAAETDAVVAVVDLLLEGVAWRLAQAQVTVACDSRSILVDMKLAPDPDDDLTDEEQGNVLAALGNVARLFGGRAATADGGARWQASLVLRR